MQPPKIRDLLHLGETLSASVNLWEGSLNVVSVCEPPALCSVDLGTHNSAFLGCSPLGQCSSSVHHAFQSHGHRLPQSPLMSFCLLAVDPGRAFFCPLHLPGRHSRSRLCESQPEVPTIHQDGPRVSRRSLRSPAPTLLWPVLYLGIGVCCDTIGPEPPFQLFICQVNWL